MKVRNYEKSEFTIFIIILVFILEILLVLFLSKYKVYEYKILTGIVSKKNLVTLVINKNEKELLNKNKKIYINNKYLDYKIIEDRGYLTKKNNIKYYEVIIKVKTKEESNDVVKLSIKDKKIECIRLLKKIWEGG